VVASLSPRFAGTAKYVAINLNELNIDVPQLDTQTEELLNEVLSIYGEHSASYLEELTHREDPWIIARGDKKPFEWCKNEITQDSMIKYYSRLNDQEAS
jgi:uncharacterized phage-associated protein